MIFWEVLAIAALILANGFLAGSEIAIVSMRRTRVDELVAEKKGGAHSVARLRGDPERFLATVQIGITVIGAAAGAFGGARVAVHLEPLLYPLLGEHSRSVAFAVVVAALSFFSLVLGELVPKSLALRVGERYALLVARPLLWLSYVARPAVWILTQSSNLVLRMFGDRTNFVESRVSPGEIQQLVDEATQTGSVDPIVGEIASRAIDFGDLTVAHVMIPRQRVVGIPRRATHEEVRTIILEQGKARMPVYEGSLDNVVGYVTLRDLMALAMETRLFVLDDAIREPLVVPGSMRCVDVLAEMRHRRLQLVIVVDEIGAMIGVATLEDVLEELVGDISSEHDESSKPVIETGSDGAVVAAGEAPIREVNRRCAMSLPETDRFTTVGGLALEVAGRIPRTGERLEVADDGTQLEVLEATPTRVLRVRLVSGDAKGRATAVGGR